MILAGDVGGTKTNIALFRFEGGSLKAIRRSTYRSGDHPGLLPIVVDFLRDHAPEVKGACFGIAGPVLDNKCRTPNLPWEIDGDEVAEKSGVPFLRLINDLRATAEGVPALGAEDVTVLNEGEPVPGAPAALIAAGTGLGMAFMTESDGQPVAHPSEGGHHTFAARSRRELRLHAFLHRRFGGHVSYERVVSGPGLENIYDHLSEEPGAHPDPNVAERMKEGDPPAEIGAAALKGECPVCEEALDIFLEAYGAAAGNLALVTLARGGLWIGGGIAPKLMPRIADGTFLRGFLDKGRFAPLLEKVPVRLIENPETAMLGAAPNRRPEALEPLTDSSEARMRLCTLVLALALLCTVASAEKIVVLDCESRGIPSPAEQYEARRISDLFWFGSHVYVGTGDAVVNTGPAPVLVMGGGTDEARTEFTVDDEAIYKYRVLDGKLVIPGPDATESWELGNIYVRGDDGKWIKHRSLPLAVHVNDLASFKGAWFATTGTVVDFAGVQMACGSILGSTDQGRTWTPEYLTAVSAGSVYRVDALATFKDKLYAFPYAYAGFPETQVPEEVRATAGSAVLNQDVGYYTLYVSDPQGTAESLVRTEQAWKQVDLIPGKRVCRIRPIPFGDRLLLSVVTGDRVAPFASYVIDKPMPVPGSTLELYAFDGEESVRVPIEYQSLLDAQVWGDTLALLVVRDGHYWIAETTDLEKWLWWALPLDRARPLCLMHGDGAYFVGTKDGNLFYAAGGVEVATTQEIGAQAVSSFELRGELPRNTHGYWAALTRWTKPGHTARAKFRAHGETGIHVDTENVAAMRIVLSWRFSVNPDIKLTIDDQVIHLGQDGGTVDCFRGANGDWDIEWVADSPDAYAPEPQIVGEATVPLGPLHKRLGEWIAETIRFATGAALAIYPASGIRGNLKAGPVSMADIHDLHYRDRIVVFDMDGADVRELLAGMSDTDARRRCHWSGTTEFEDGTAYRVAMSGYAARRGERFFGRKIEGIQTKGWVHTALIDRLQRDGKIPPEKGGDK